MSEKSEKTSAAEQQAALKASPSDIAKLRHLYANLKNGGVRDTAQAKRIADGLLAPIIERLEQATPQAAADEGSDETDWYHGMTEKHFDRAVQKAIQRDRASRAAAPKAAPVEPVHGDVLPPVGSRVYIRHGRDNDAHACTVTGYYAWGDLGGDKRLHRVFVRLVYEGTDRQQARMLCDCYPTAEAALAQAAPQQEAQEPVAYVHVPHYTVEGKVRPVVSFEKYRQDYADGIYSTRIPLYAAPQPAPAPATPDGDELRKIARAARTSASDDASPTEYVLAGWRAALAAQGGKE